MNWPVTRLVLMGLGAASVVTIGCDMAASQEGDEGNLEFVYVAADGDRTFDRPLAEGSGMEMSLEPMEDRELERVNSVSTNPDTVLGAELLTDPDEEEDLFLWGIDVGEALLSVEAQGGGVAYSDSTTIRVSRVSQASLAHECTRLSDAAYMVDYPLSLELDRQNYQGETLIGAAFSSPDAVNTCQVQMAPSFYQKEAYCDEAGLHFFPIHDVGPIDVELISGIESVGRSSSSSLTMHVIDPSHVDFETIDGEVPLDGTRRFQLEPFTTPLQGTGTWPVCTDLDLYVTILSTDTCSGPTGELDFFIEPEDENEVRLRGRSTGRCEFAVELADRPDLGDWVFSVMVRD